MTKKDKLNWTLNSAGDWELKTATCRYRIEETPAGVELIRKPFSLSAYSETVARFKSVDEAMRWVDENESS